MPLLGAGTWQYNETVAYDSLCKAFDAGYTFVDTAFGYGNQRGVGLAIRDYFKGSREELFVMTKIPGGLRRGEVLAAHRTNLFELGLDYVDHLMTHFPSDWGQAPDRSSPEVREEEWLALESIYYRGEARSLGVSHYCPRHIDDVLDVASVRPSINQVEYHVGSGDVDGVMDKCREEGIYFMSFSPLCGPCELASPEDSLVSGKLVNDIAERYEGDVTGAQVSLRFIVQQALEEEGEREGGVNNGRSYVGAVIPKSNDERHIRSNLGVFSFELSDEDMDRLRGASVPAAEAGDCDVP